MGYKHFAELDYYDALDEDETMSNRFSFYKSSRLYSYNQAVWMMGICIKDFESDEFEVKAYDTKVGRIQKLYKGNKCFDWYTKIKADSLRDFKTIDFCNKDTHERFSLERLRLNGEYRYIVYTG